MLIAHLRFPIAPENRQAATEALVADVKKVRAMKGCLAFYPVHDPLMTPFWASSMSGRPRRISQPIPTLICSAALARRSAR